MERFFQKVAWQPLQGPVGKMKRYRITDLAACLHIKPAPKPEPEPNLLPSVRRHKTSNKLPGLLRREQDERTVIRKPRRVRVFSNRAIYQDRHVRIIIMRPENNLQLEPDIPSRHSNTSVEMPVQNLLV
jgi:hypothetical protein